MAAHTEYTAFRAFGTGFRRLSGAWGTAFGLYVGNLLWAVLWSLPLLWTLDQILGGRPAGDRVANQWDLEILVEMLLDHPELLRLGLALGLFSLIGYGLFSVFVTGGVAAVVGESERPTLSEAARAGVAAFGRVLALSLFYLIVLGVSFFLLMVLVGFSSGVSEHMGPGGKLFTGVVFALPAIFLFVYADAAMDYSRIHAANHEGPGVTVAALKFGLKLVFRRGLAALWLHLGFSLLAMAPAAILFLLPADFDGGGTLRLFFGFLIWQVLIFVRVALRLSALTGQKLYCRAEPEWTA